MFRTWLDLDIFDSRPPLFFWESLVDSDQHSSIRPFAISKPPLHIRGFKCINLRSDSRTFSSILQIKQETYNNLQIIVQKYGI